MFNPFKHSWKRISLYRFQQIEEINNRNISDLDKTLWTICAVFDKTEYELDNLPVKKVEKLIGKVETIFKSDVKTKPAKKIGKFKVQYDPSKLTFGQYTELAFFLQAPIKNAHYVLASMVSPDASKHRERAEYFLGLPIEKVLGAFSLFIEKFGQFNGEYKNLFGLDPAVNGESATESQFNKYYGWIYAASQIAEYERITLDETYALPVRRAFNDLAYLKAKSKYEAEQTKTQLQRLNKH